MMSSLPEVYSAKMCPPGLPATENNHEKPSEKSKQCPICKLYYKYGNSFWQHVRYVHANYLSQCIICGKSYKRTTMAKQHILHFHKIAWHLCVNYIKKVKKNDQPLQSKIKEKSMERKKQNLKYLKKKTLHLISSFNCYDCPQAFSTITELFTHVKVHKHKRKTDSEVESDAEDIPNISENEVKGIQNGFFKEIKDIQKESVNENEEIQNGEANEADDIQNASVIEIEQIQNESVTEIEKIPNRTVNEFEETQSLLKNDVTLKIQ